jgi:class 3 adenylate cyclase
VRFQLPDTRAGDSFRHSDEQPAVNHDPKDCGAPQAITISKGLRTESSLKQPLLKEYHVAVLSLSSKPQEIDLLVGFFDLTRFHPYATSTPVLEVATLLSDYYELVGEIIEDSGGQVLKFMGDAALTVHSEADVDRGVLALLDLKTRGDAWLDERGVRSENRVTAHFGSVAAAAVGTKTDKRVDIFSEVVNVAVTMRSTGFAMSAQVFRKLSADTRKLFKKHTPPITYIPTDQRHR